MIKVHHGAEERKEGGEIKLLGPSGKNNPNEVRLECLPWRSGAAGHAYPCSIYRDTGAQASWNRRTCCHRERLDRPAPLGYTPLTTLQETPV